MPHHAAALMHQVGQPPEQVALRARWRIVHMRSGVGVKIAARLSREWTGEGLISPHVVVVGLRSRAEDRMRR